MTREAGEEIYSPKQWFIVSVLATVLAATTVIIFIRRRSSSSRPLVAWPSLKTLGRLPSDYVKVLGTHV